MSKELENKTCECCGSSFRLVYTLDKTSGFSKFCPFCGEEISEDDPQDLEYEDEE